MIRFKNNIFILTPCLILVQLLAMVNNSNGQVNQLNAIHCKCADNSHTHRTKPDTLFMIPSIGNVALCGNISEIKKDIYFTEFDLSLCGVDTIIKYWHALQFCQIKIIKDGFIVREMKYLPIGADQLDKFIAWTNEEFIFENNSIIRNLTINKEIPLYTKKQIKSAISSYKNSDKENQDEIVLIISKLFMASISGSSKAKKYFNSLNSKFDAANAERYDELQKMLIAWDSIME